MRMRGGSIAVCLLLACRDDGGSVWNGDGSGTGGGATAADGAGSAGDGGASGTGVATGGSADGTATGTAGDDGDGDDGGTTGRPIFDVGGGQDTDFEGCGCDLAYIWIANSDESTVSKIDTQTLQEVGRYRTRADGAGNPSRTSVSLSGDVAVANRHGGLVKFWAQESDCVESNGMPGIQTSSGAGDVLAWDVEECRAWYTDIAATNQRPVAWKQGTTIGECDTTGEQVWTVASETPGFAPGTGGAGGVVVYLVDGATGDIDEELLVAEFSGLNLGAYGGAVDGEGNLYFTPMGGLALGTGQLARVDAESLDVTLWPIPPEVATYGITVDQHGRVWVSSIIGAGAARFDPQTEQWDIVQGSFLSAGGLAVGPDDHVWIATDAGAISVEIDTLALGNVFVAPSGGTVKGISVDVDGYVWAVNGIAWKIDPGSGVDVGSYNGLSSPYTYSDMTGWALLNATCPPEG